MPPTLFLNKNTEGVFKQGITIESRQNFPKSGFFYVKNSTRYSGLAAEHDPNS